MSWKKISHNHESWVNRKKNCSDMRCYYKTLINFWIIIDLFSSKFEKLWICNAQLRNFLSKPGKNCTSYFLTVYEVEDDFKKIIYRCLEIEESLEQTLTNFASSFGIVHDYTAFDGNGDSFFGQILPRFSQFFINCLWKGMHVSVKELL